MALERRVRGQSTVEFALVLPVLLLVLLGIMQFGMLFNAQITLVNAARQGARYGAVPSVTEAEIKEKVKEEADLALLINKENVSVSVTSRDTAPEFTVTVEYSYKTGLEGVLTGLARIFSPGAPAVSPIKLKASATMKMER